MYKKVLLANDGSIEGRRALREGAKLAQLCRAEVFLLAVVQITSVASLEGGLAIPIDEQIANYKAILAEGVERLKASNALRRWASHRRRGWAWEPPETRSPRSPKRSEQTSSSWVIVPPGRWRDGGSALSAPTWSSIFAAVSWWPKPKSATINLPS
jgi:hypothetical protein